MLPLSYAASSMEAPELAKGVSETCEGWTVAYLLRSLQMVFLAEIPAPGCLGPEVWMAGVGGTALGECCRNALRRQRGAEGPPGESGEDKVGSKRGLQVGERENESHKGCEPVSIHMSSSFDKSDVKASPTGYGRDAQLCS